MPGQSDKLMLDIALRAADEEARQLDSTTIEAEHLLLALTADTGSPVGTLLAGCGLDRSGVLAALERETEQSLAAVGVALRDFALPARAPSKRSMKLAASCRRVIERAGIHAATRNERHLTSAHLLVGILQAEIGTVPRALAAAGIDRRALLARSEHLLG